MRERDVPTVARGLPVVGFYGATSVGSVGWLVSVCLTGNAVAPPRHGVWAGAPPFLQQPGEAQTGWPLAPGRWMPPEHPGGRMETPTPTGGSPEGRLRKMKINK